MSASFGTVPPDMTRLKNDFGINTNGTIDINAVVRIPILDASDDQRACCQWWFGFTGRSRLARSFSTKWVTPPPNFHPRLLSSRPHISPHALCAPLQAVEQNTVLQQGNGHRCSAMYPPSQTDKDYRHQSLECISTIKFFVDQLVPRYSFRPLEALLNSPRWIPQPSPRQHIRKGLYALRHLKIHVTETSNFKLQKALKALKTS
ncbi:hypothetical protein BDZ89DRAFT_1036895 [Hymenopellis radicata]|nr:hypothetical protein BDZ89DRAFT_1036895 [Hymenopellis radicata]